MSQSDIICMSITDCNMYGHNKVNIYSCMTWLILLTVLLSEDIMLEGNMFRRS